MTRHSLNQKYFMWMCQFVSDNYYFKRLSYRKLLTHLHNTEFTYILGMDGNRAEDGVDLRYRFGYDNCIEDYVTAEYLDDKPCSMLEMLIALSVRCEEHIMDDPDVGDRTGQWFWNMITNLGLSSMSDSKFHEQEANDIIERFLNREYKQNGEGGLFVIPHCRYDLRTIEIWYQAMWYLDEALKH